MVTATAAMGITHTIIVHRLSTVRNADNIVVLASVEGTITALTGSVIIEQESNDELMMVDILVSIGEKNKSSDSMIGLSNSAIDLVTMQKAITVDI